MDTHNTQQNGPATSQEKTRRNPNFSEAEKLVVLQFVQNHKQQLMGKAGRPGHGDDKVEERKAKSWKKCADAVNMVGGNARDWKCVKKQWQSLQDKAKKSKQSMGRTGGGPCTKTTPAIELALEVVAREALEGVRSKNTELDPSGQVMPELSQDSSQESVAAPDTRQPTTVVHVAATTSAATSVVTPRNDNIVIQTLQNQVKKLESQLLDLASQPSALQRATEIRHLKYQEELLKLEKRKFDVMVETLEVQKKMLSVMESAGARSLFNSMTEQ